MQKIAETGMMENIKEKMANPVLFTYFWIFCSVNIKHIFYLFYMPMLVSDKFGYLSDKWNYDLPIILTFVVLFVTPWINNIVEIWKQVAHRWLQTQMQKSKFKALIEDDVYQAIKDKLSTTKNSVIELEKNIEDKQEKILEFTRNLAKVSQERKHLLDDVGLYKVENDRYSKNVKGLTEWCDYAVDSLRQINDTEIRKGFKITNRKLISSYEDYINTPDANPNILTRHLPKTVKEAFEGGVTLPTVKDKEE